MMRSPIGLAIAGLVLLLAPLPAAQEELSTTAQFHSLSESPLLYIDDTVFTVGKFGDYLYSTGTRPTGRREKDLDTLQRSLAAFIDERVIILDLDSNRALEDPWSRRRARARQAQAAGAVIYRIAIAPRIDITEEAVEQFYADTADAVFRAPVSREVSHILIPLEPNAAGHPPVPREEREATARARADSLRQAIEAGASFTAIARTLSADDATAELDGYLGWLYPGNTTFSFDSAVFQAEIGRVVGPVKTTFGYHLILVHTVRPERTLELTDSLRTLIRTHLAGLEARRLGEIWSDSVIQAADWEFNDAAMARTADIDDGTWLVNINDRDSLWYRGWKGSWLLYKRKHDIVGEGSLEEKHAALRDVGFPFLYLHTAEDLGLGDDPIIYGERLQHMRSEWSRLVRQELYALQTPPDSAIERVKIEAAAVEESDKPLHLQILRAGDTASIWGAYRALVGGTDVKTVARWYHQNMLEARAGTWDKGWVGHDDIPGPLWGPAWILTAGRYTRPIEYESAWYILRLVERKRQIDPAQAEQKGLEELTRQYRRRGLIAWREEIRSGHRIRTDRSAWDRLQQIWRK